MTSPWFYVSHPLWRNVSLLCLHNRRYLLQDFVNPIDSANRRKTSSWERSWIRGKRDFCVYPSDNAPRLEPTKELISLKELGTRYEGVLDTRLRVAPALLFLHSLQQWVIYMMMVKGRFVFFFVVSWPAKAKQSIKELWKYIKIKQNRFGKSSNAALSAIWLVGSLLLTKHLLQKKK